MSRRSQSVAWTCRRSDLAQYLPRGAHSTLQSSGHSAGLACGVRRFPGEEQRALYRCSERLARRLAADEHVAVRAACETIGLPVVLIRAFSSRCTFTFLPKAACTLSIAARV